jgi:hypothetical protein
MDNSDVAKSKKAAAPITDKELTRRLFSKSVRKQLKAALSEYDARESKRKGSAKR